MRDNVAKMREGNIIGWKVAWSPDHKSHRIVKLAIGPATQMRYTWINPNGKEVEENHEATHIGDRHIVGKCRSAHARVVCIQNVRGDTLAKNTVAISDYDCSFVYYTGLSVSPRKKFSRSKFESCTNGIHFFVSRKEAVEYAITL